MRRAHYRNRRGTTKSLPDTHANTSVGLKKAFHRRLLSSTVEEQRRLTSAVVPDEHDSWNDTDGSQSIHRLARALKGRPGDHQLFLGTDLRVLGEGMDDIRTAVKALRKVNVTIYDMSNPDETDIIDMLARAQKGMRWNGDQRHQKNKGRKGGTAKGIKAEAKRNVILANEIVIRMCAHPKLTLKDCAGILGPPFSASTLDRNYR